ncbi:MAG: DUF2889 domain-containing protein [Desulfitobacterium hafniense]|nr:DUF2889 domain-containing protein [Desulfitobacterium hafniense]
MFLFNRSINVSVTKDHDHVINIQSFLLDSHHEISLAIRVDPETDTIIYASAELCRTLHDDCKITQELVKNLIGITFTRDIRKQIVTAIGRDKGCTHLTDLTIECVKAFKQAKFRLMSLTLSKPELERQLRDYLVGTCFHFRVKV